jgi:TP901 family phage tail tape measure protein
MARVELNIVALGDFKSVNSQIKALQDQVNLLNKSVASVGVNANLTKQLNEANNAFKATLLSTGQFTAQTVKLKAETDKFGEALVNGKLKLTQYFQIIKAGTTNATAQMRALAMEQTKLQNSMVMSDPTKQGVMSVYTPTKINAMANATKIAANTQNLYNIAVDKGAQSLINWGKNTQWAGRQLTVGMTVPLTIFGSTATQVFQQVNDEIVRLQKVYGTGLQQPTQAALDSIKKQVLDLSKELATGMGVAVKDTAAMAADLAATGLQGMDLIGATRESIRLQKLGEMDQQSAMQTTISLQNVYKLSTNQLSGAIDFLNAVENQTSTSMQDLASGIPKVGPIVQQLGGSFKDTAIMMVAMKEAGVPAAQSANAIKSALASLINPTKAAKDAFAAYNINLSSIATKTGGNPVQMIMMLQEALKGLQPLAQAQLIEKLFGKFQEARIQALISNLGAVNSQTKQAFDLMNASESQLKGIAAGELKVATESTTGKFRRAVETMKADLLPVGEKIMQVATSLLNFGNSIAKVFGGLPGPVKTVLGIVAAGVALSGPIIMFTGVLANFVGYLIKGLFSMKDLINGTKTFGQLFTPEIIASQNAAQIFSQKILQDESAVMLLNKAVRELTVSLEGMAAGMAAASGTSMAGKLLAAEAGLAGGRIPFRGPKMASGGYVPGSGNTDSYPAMLMPGEAVIPKSSAQKYQPLINGMINETLPGFADGTNGGYSNIFGPNAKKFEPKTDLTSSGRSFRGTIGGYRPLPGGDVPQKLPADNMNTIAPNNAPLDLAHMAGNLSPGDKGYDQFFQKNPGFLNVKDRISVLSQLTATLPHNINKQLDKGSANIGDFEKAYTSAGPLKFGTSAVKGGLSTSDLKTLEIIKASKDFEDELLKRVKALGKQQVSDQDLYKVTETLIKETKDAPGAMGKFVTSLHNASKQFGGFRSKMSAAELRLGVATGDIQKVPSIKSKYAYETGMLYKDGVPVGQYGGSSGEGSIRGKSANAYGFGKNTKTSKEIEEARQIALANAINIESESKSPSKATKRAAKNMVDGVTEGIKESRPKVKAAANTAMEEALAANAAGGGEYTNLATETEPGLAATSRSGGRFAKFNAARMSARAKLQSRMPKMMTGRFSGLGMGLGLQLAGQFAAPMINKLPGGSIANDAITGASYGAFLGPEGAAAGAAIGGIIGGISKLMNAEKMHKANAEATFTASTSAAQMFGSAVTDASTPVISLGGLLDKTVSKADRLKTQSQSFIDEVNKLPKDDPLSITLQKIKKASNSKEASEIASAFAATQQAINGMDTAAAQKMIDLLLASGGKGGSAKAKDLGGSITDTLNSVQTNKPRTKQQESVLAGIQKDIDTYTGGTMNYEKERLKKAKEDLEKWTTWIDKENTKSGKSSQEQQKLIKNITNETISASTPFKTYQQRLDGIKKSTNDTNASLKKYADSIKKDKGDLPVYTALLAKRNLTLSQAVPILSLMSKEKNSPLIAQIMEASKNPKSTSFVDLLKKVNAELDKIKKPSESSSTLSANGSPLSPEEIAANRVTNLQKKYKPILDLENKRTTELERQKALMDAQNTAAQDAINYATQQTDLQSQIRQAMANGDYLKANLLRQQMAGAADKYQMGVISNQNTQAIDQGRQMYADAQAKISEGKSLTPAEVKALKGYNPKLGTYNLGSVNMPAAVQYGSAAQLGTTGANIPAINVVINGSNLTSDQLEAAARSAVTGALAQAGVKTSMSGTKSKVGG